MFNKIKTFISNSTLNSLNEKYFRNLKFKKIGKIVFNTKIEKEFNLNYLNTPIKEYLSNDLGNKKKIEDIYSKNEKNNEYSDLVEHLNIKIIDCLNILRYMHENINDKINNKFNEKLVEFLEKEYQNFKYEREILEKNKKVERDEKTMKKIEELNVAPSLLKNNYIGAFILLVYNYENAFNVKKARKISSKRKNKNKSSPNIKFITKKNNTNK